MSNHLEMTEEEIAALLRLDLMSFVERCFRELNPEQELHLAPHLPIMAGKIADALLRRGAKRLIINLPPRSLKSITVSVAAVAWLLGHDPSGQVICASYGQDLADKHARDTRTIMASPFYGRLFPATLLSAQKQSVNDFMTTKQGFRMATSVGGVLTGRGADVIILDDPLKPDDALSEPRRSAVNDWYDNTLLSRLNNKRDGVIILVMQRLHQNDLVGHVLEHGEDWEVVSFPAIAREDECHTAEAVFGPVVFRRKAGEPLDPVREPLSTLNNIRKSTGEYNFASQYQQDPTPMGGALVKRDWLHHYDPEGSLPQFSLILQSWDTASKAGELNDFSVCTTWGFHNKDYYLLDVFRKRLNYPDLKRAVIDQKERHSANRILIEDKSSGTQLIQDLRNDLYFEIEPYQPPSTVDKVMRLVAQTAKFENGRVKLPTEAPWLDEYVRELTSFPGSRFDDQVDSTAQALNYLGQHGFSIYDAL